MGSGERSVYAVLPLPSEGREVVSKGPSAQVTHEKQYKKEYSSEEALLKIMEKRTASHK